MPKGRVLYPIVEAWRCLVQHILRKALNGKRKLRSNVSEGTGSNLSESPVGHVRYMLSSREEATQRAYAHGSAWIAPSDDMRGGVG